MYMVPREKGREGLIAVAVNSPVIVPPFCGRARALDVITMEGENEGASDGNL